MIIHFLWALFMVLGLPLGLLLKSPGLRWVHLLGMMITAYYAISGLQCPLTVWEEALRRAADQSFTFDGGFLAHYLSSILYPPIEPWVLRGVSAFWGVLTIVTMVMIKPEKRTGNSKE